jgi:hypothetical protein
MSINPRPLRPRGPFYRERTNYALGFTLSAVAVALILGVGVYSLSQHKRGPTAANPPAVTAPAPRVPAPVQDETTGQLAPRMQ